MKAKRLSQYTVEVDISDLRRNALIQEQLEKALEILVDKYVANRGTEHQFITCIGSHATPYYWENAINAFVFSKAFGTKLEYTEADDESN